MKCKICDSCEIEVIYDGKIRDGKLGHYTDESIKIYKCNDCGVIWHDRAKPKGYYESGFYRQHMGEIASREFFYKRHDKETLDKILYIGGVQEFRDKVVSDIGCGGGTFLDMIGGLAKRVLAIEPTEAYHDSLRSKGWEVYSYADMAKEKFSNKVDIATSFDVIEHVNDPLRFLSDVCALLIDNGKFFCGTPSDAPIMRMLLGSVYEQKVLYSTQHLLIFSEKNMRILSQKAGFRQMKVKYYQRYGLGNLMSWLKDKEPRGDMEYDFVSSTLDEVYKQEVCRQGLGDYVVYTLIK